MLAVPLISCTDVPVKFMVLESASRVPFISKCLLTPRVPLTLSVPSTFSRAHFAVLAEGINTDFPEGIIAESFTPGAPDGDQVEAVPHVPDVTHVRVTE